ncbi:uncharacterized protein PV06_04699 [Exophiala oligosperma]|uniref:Poly(A) RNA polymerase mitochondrial-like central palm domain-containing protein n=2 Tax=Chaetothyriales TaxID=34395 RepID=A0A0D2DKW0_9EURO|nr:uncharacterized protein PV06_04699 [Exophiala oligosperma]KAJ9631314.1 hypothetical protein H2204_008256 [Knufia peltigerae]KIW43613.1 hypothetical protein PV06_04699 [Exophiala oligosperma]
MLAACVPSRPLSLRFHYDVRSLQIAPVPWASTVKVARSHHACCLASDLAKSDDEPSRTAIPTPIFRHEPNVDLNSLRNTLEAHRAANRASVIRKIDRSGRSIPLDVGKFLPRGVYTPEHSVPNLRKKKDGYQIKHIPGKKGSSDSRNKGTYRDLSGLWRVEEDNGTLSTRSRMPWLAHITHTQTAPRPSACDRLADEIRAFGKYATPSEEEKRAANVALDEIVRAIRIADENLDVAIIGSRKTGVDDPLSDLDLNVTNILSPATMRRFRTPVEILALLERAFSSHRRSAQLPEPPLDVVINIRHARVPILVCHHRQTGLPVQIQSTPRALDNTEYVKAFLHEYPTLRSLYKVLKQLLVMRALHLGSQGGLTSYPLIIMIVAALKFCEGRFEPTDVASQFLFFLDMYTDIDFYAQGISTRPLGYFPKHIKEKEFLQRPLLRDAQLAALYADEIKGQRRMSVQHQWKRYRMTLQDPADPSNELGGGVNQIRDIQETLIYLRSRIKEAMAKWDDLGHLEHGLSEEHFRTHSLLESCVSGDYRVYETERNELRMCVRN